MVSNPNMPSVKDSMYTGHLLLIATISPTQTCCPVKPVFPLTITQVLLYLNSRISPQCTLSSLLIILKKKSYLLLEALSDDCLLMLYPFSDLLLPLNVFCVTYVSEVLIPLGPIRFFKNGSHML